MKKAVVLIVLILSLVFVSGLAYAQDEASNAPTQISTWTLSPNPVAVSGTVTTNIAFAFVSVDATTRFCIVGPSNAGGTDASWYGTMPATIPLRLRQGFTSETVNFAKSDGAATCGDSRSALYTGTYTASFNAASAINVTTSTGSVINLTAGGNVATAGIGNWEFVLEEPSGVPGASVFALQLTSAETPYTGLSGRLIDSKTLQPWGYGAEIQVVQTTGINTGVKGSTSVAADGTWQIDFGATDSLNLCPTGGCTPGNNYATYRIFVNYTCNLQTANGTRPAFNSSTDPNCPVNAPLSGGFMVMNALVGLPINTEFTVTDAATGNLYDTGDFETERGPTAVTLQNFGLQSNATLLPLIVLSLALMAGATIFVARRRQG
jgi:hypothetical protein